MSETAQITTIIRTYNRRDHTLAAVRSAVGQTLTGQPVVVVDDGSTDGVAEAIASAYGNRVQVVRHDSNKGVGAAANTGLAAVTTPYAAFLDSDDLWEPEFLQTMLSAIGSATGATLAYSDFRFEFPEHRLDYAVGAKEPDALKDRLMSPPFTMSSVVVRTRSARAVGPFDESKQIGEDSDFYIRLWLRAPDSFVHVKQNLVRHRIWTGNTTMDLNKLIREMDSLTRRYLRHPYFSHLQSSYTEVVRHRLLGVAARHQVYKWLSAIPKRAMSLVVTGTEKPADLEKSLNSAATQRLPPVDVAVVVSKDIMARVDPNTVTGMNWPFNVHVVTMREGKSPGEQIQYAINVLVGNAILFLKAGDTFSDGALDAHRYAFSCSPQSVLMSYGGLNDQIPGLLPVDKASIALRLLTDSSFRSLSAVAIARKALTGSGIIPKKREKGFCVNLLLNLLARNGAIVRVEKQVASSSNVEIVALETLHDIVRDVSETETGHRFIGALDQALDRLEPCQNGRPANGSRSS
ncbi:MAG: glycosyltransferase family A protein [Alphaproteobacteria bacterium]